MTINPTTATDRLPNLGQAVERLLDAIAGSPDYQRTGSVTYQYQPKSGGRWQSGEHKCGGGTIDTAERNHLITFKVDSPIIKTLALTPAGRRHVRVRQTRRFARQEQLLESTTITVADLLQRTGPDVGGRMFTVEASVVIQEERRTRKGDLWAVLDLDDGTALMKVMVFPRPYAEAGADLLMPSDQKLRFTGRLDVRENTPRLIVQTVQGFRKADAR